jgi:hypothetical protein
LKERTVPKTYFSAYATQQNLNNDNNGDNDNSVSNGSNEEKGET